MTEDTSQMTSHRPYLLRALYEWISDNDMTPHLLVDAGQPGVQVPPHTVKDGKVVLNIAARAVVAQVRRPDRKATLAAHRLCRWGRRRLARPCPARFRARRSQGSPTPAPTPDG